MICPGLRRLGGKARETCENGKQELESLSFPLEPRFCFKGGTVLSQLGV